MVTGTILGGFSFLGFGVCTFLPLLFAASVAAAGVAPLCVAPVDEAVPVAVGVVPPGAVCVGAGVAVGSVGSVVGVVPGVAVCAAAAGVGAGCCAAAITVVPNASMAIAEAHFDQADEVDLVNSENLVRIADTPARQVVQNGERAAKFKEFSKETAET
jgi:hypothetical protein